RLLEGGSRGAEASTGGRGGGPRRLAVHHRRRGGHDLAGDVQRAVEGGNGRQRAVEVAGYSGKPLVQKLGIKDGWAIAILNAPKGYDRILGKLPPQVSRKASAVGPLDFVQFFTAEKRELERRFGELARALAPAGMLWIS